MSGKIEPILIDTAKRRRTGKLQRGSAQDFQAIVSKSTDAMAVIDREGGIQYANPAAESLFGLPASGLAGTSFGFPAAPLDEPVKLRILRGSGDFAEVEMRMVEVVWAGQPSYLLSFRDLKDQAMAEKAISQSRDRLEALVEERTRELSEEALRESEDRFRAIFSRAALGLAITDPAGRILDCNSAYEKMLGYSKEELQKISFLDITHPDDIDKNRSLHRQMFEGLIDSYQLEKRYIRRDGGAIWCNVVASAIRNPDGTLKNNMAVIEDITGRRQAEEALRESEDRFRAIYENAAMGINMLSPDGRYLMVNDKFCELTGYTRGELLGMTIRDVYNAEDLARIENDFRRLITGEISVYSSELRFKRKDGQVRWVDVSNSLVRTDGKPAYLVRVVKDITERRRAEDAVRESKAKLEAVFSSMNDGVIIFGPDGKATNANDAAARFHRFTETEVFFLRLDDYADMFDVRHLDGTPSAMEDWPASRALRGEVLSNYELMLTRRDTGESWIGSYSAAPIRYPGGKVIAAVVTMRDVTERKRAEKEAEEAKAWTELYLDLMGHDINNMNMAARGFLEIAREAVDREGRLDLAKVDLLDSAMASIDSSSRLISNVRKLQRGRMGKYKREVYDLGALIKEAVGQFKLVPDGHVSISCGMAEGVRVQANELLQDVFVNLIGNAIKHARGPASVSIRMNLETKYGRRYCRISVEDDGPGIPDELKDVIFDRFRRGNTKAKGSGLGLYLVRTLVESYEGNVWVEDRVPGDYTKGARFVVILPAIDN